MGEFAVCFQIGSRWEDEVAFPDKHTQTNTQETNKKEKGGINNRNTQPGHDKNFKCFVSEKQNLKFSSELFGKHADVIILIPL